MITPESDAPRWLVRMAAIGWRILVLFAAIIVLAYTARLLRLVVEPFLIALFLTAILYRPSQALKRARVPLVISSILGPLVCVLVLVGSVFAGVLIVRGQSGGIAESVGNGWQALSDWISQRDGAIAGVDLADLVTRATTALRERSDEVAAALARGAATTLTAITEVLFAAVIAFFLLRDGESLVKSFLDRLPEDTAKRVAHTGREMWSRVEGYLRGIAITAVANAILFGIALLIIGVPFVVPIMFITFVGSFIPYAGPVIATVLASLVAIADGGASSALWVVVSGITVQQIEGNLLSPIVVGRAVSLSPLIVLLAVASGAIVAGLIGAFVAVPIVAALAVLFEPAAAPKTADAESDDAQRCP